VGGSGLNPGAEKTFSFPTTDHTGPGPHQTSCTMGTMALQRRKALISHSIYRRGSE